ncbi:Uncharacterised protein [Streptococcus pneumoniae]|nr:Uncharacterised protein [Streptococcus pneumoniae]
MKPAGFVVNMPSPSVKEWSMRLKFSVFATGNEPVN